MAEPFLIDIELLFSITLAEVSVSCASAHVDGQLCARAKCSGTHRTFRQTSMRPLTSPLVLIVPVPVNWLGMAYRVFVVSVPPPMPKWITQ